MPRAAILVAAVAVAICAVRASTFSVLHPTLCTINPCLNGGTCMESLSAFSCQCAAGFTGTTCDIKYDGFCGPTLNTKFTGDPTLPFQSSVGVPQGVLPGSTVDPVSFSGWVRLQHVNHTQYLMATQITGRQPVGLIAQPGVNTQYAVNVQDGANLPTAVPFTTHTPASDIGTWVHWAVTVSPSLVTSATTITVYRNGVAEGTVSIGRLFQNSVAMQWSMDGVSLGDVRSYDVLLTPAQVLTVYRGASTTPPPSIRYYNMTHLTAPVSLNAVVSNSSGVNIFTGSLSAVMLQSNVGVGMWVVPSCACASNPCLNGGICRSFIGEINAEDSYTCGCSSKFNGTRCEFQLSSGKATHTVSTLTYFIAALAPLLLTHAASALVGSGM